MATSKTHTTRLVFGLAAAGMLLIPLAGCSGTADTPSAFDSTRASVSLGAPGGESSGSTGASTSAGSTSSAGGSSTPGGVDCSGTSCSLTLSGEDAQADAFGTRISLGGVENGRATLRVGDADVSCGQGESVSAGPLTLKCTTVTADSVTLTASLG